MKKLVKLISSINKYWLAAIIFAVITFVIGDSTLIKRISYDREISRLNTEIENNISRKELNQQKLKALQSDSESLEKLAREQYQMVKPDEDLYIVVE
ncbi:MAG: septum formation initiator family protein [Dysgonamonadaceae bacterium]|jgi:cell division protein FtsB|nr:septum formation initiator family protein [Dysgonamonadaceae bacterium]